jgi:hypothetical protein
VALSVASHINALRTRHLEWAACLARFLVELWEMWRRVWCSPCLLTKSKVNLVLSQGLGLSLIDGKHKLFHKFIVLWVTFWTRGINNLWALPLLEEHWSQSLVMSFPMEGWHYFFWWNRFHRRVRLKMFVCVENRFQFGGVVEIPTFWNRSLNSLLW